MHSLPHTINNTLGLLKDNITTHNLYTFSSYTNPYYLNTYTEQCVRFKTVMQYTIE